MSAPDVIVIGAGIIGASIAWRLAQSGAAVTLVDAGRLGGEASWAGAGMLAPGGEITERSAWGEFALESLASYPDFVKELASESGVRIDFRGCGAIEIARTEAEWRDLAARREAQWAIGIRAEIANVDSPAVGALFYPDDSIVDPRDITRALCQVCQFRRVRILKHTPVRTVRLNQLRVDVEIAAGVLSASTTVLAAGAWSGQIPVYAEGARLEIPSSFPVRGHLLGYHLQPGSLQPILRHGHTYLLQRSNGFTIAGTSSEDAGFNRDLDPAVVADIQARATELFPSLREVPDPEAWLGFRPAAANFEPVIRRFGDTRLWLAYGHYRNGILLAPATAARISNEIKSSWGTGSPGHPV